METLEDGPSWSLSLERLAVSESRFFFCSGKHKSSGSSGTSQSTKGILRVSYGTLTQLVASTKRFPWPDLLSKGMWLRCTPRETTRV